MRSIKDSVHDHIEVRGIAEELLDTAPMQRLRRIKQLGTATLAYPSANHTRFEHSLGVYHLATRALDYLTVDEYRARHARVAALLHDIGHGPYSHNLEPLIERATGHAHDDVHDLLYETELADILTDHALDPDRIADLIQGEGKLGQLIAGDLDVDRMDYLVRDAHHTGVPYGTIDVMRLVRQLTFDDGTLALQEGNVQTAESLLIARSLMRSVVSHHHVARISRAMLLRAAERLLDTDTVTPTDLRRMDDYEFRVALRQTPATQPLSRRLDTRNLFKRVRWAELHTVPKRVLDAEFDTVREYEREIAEIAGVEPYKVILDVPPRPTATQAETRVIVNGDVRRLDQQSALVDALHATHQSQWRLGVYAADDVVASVDPAVEQVLGVPQGSAPESEQRIPK